MDLIRVLLVLKGKLNHTFRKGFRECVIHSKVGMEILASVLREEYRETFPRTLEPNRPDLILATILPKINY